MDSPIVYWLKVVVFGATILGAGVYLLIYLFEQRDAKKRNEVELQERKLDSIANRKEKEIKSTSGLLDNSISKDVVVAHFVIRGSGTELVGINGSFEIGNSDDRFKIINNNGELLINATFRDSKGEPIGYLENNIWKVAQIGYDFNNDSTAFELVTADKRVLFQIEIVGDAAHIAGLISGVDGSGGYWYPNPGAEGGALATIIVKGEVQGKPFHIPRGLIKHIFKYPREMFHGIRDN